MTKEQIRHEILINLKTNGVYVSGDLWFSLAFRTKEELIKIAQEMNIRVK